MRMISLTFVVEHDSILTNARLDETVEDVVNDIIKRPVLSTTKALLEGKCRWLRNGVPLEPGLTISNLCVNDGDTIIMDAALLIFVQTHTCQIRGVSCYLDEYVHEMKKRIWAITNAPPEARRLKLFGKEIVKDNAKVREYSIQNHSLLKMPNKHIRITSAQRAPYLNLFVYGTDTPLSMKQHVSYVRNIPVEKQVLIDTSTKRTMSDDSSLESQTTGMIFDVFLACPLFIRTESGREIQFNLMSKTTCGHILEHVCEILGLPSNHMCLMYDNKILDNKTHAERYDISPGDTALLKTSMIIYVSIAEADMLAVTLTAADIHTLEALSRMLLNEKQLNTKTFVVKWCEAGSSKQLEGENLSLRELNIRDGDKMIAYVGRQVDIQLTRGGESPVHAFTRLVYSGDPVDDLKKAVCQQLNESEHNISFASEIVPVKAHLDQEGAKFGFQDILLLTKIDVLIGKQVHL